MDYSIWELLKQVGFALVGLAFFEGQRIYKCTTVGKNPLPGGRLGWHLVGLGILSIVSAVLAMSFAFTSPYGAIVMGFSVPSGIKSVLAQESPPSKIDDNWSSDSEVERDDSFLKRSIYSWIIDFFDLEH